MAELSLARAERQNAYGTSKEQILSAAELLFAQNGFSRTTLKDVAKESGANTALVGYHFGSKDGLRTAVIKRQFRLILNDFKPVLDQPGVLDDEKLEAIVDALLEAASENKTLYCIHLWGLVDGKEQAQQVMTEVYQPIIECLSAIIHAYRTRSSGPITGSTELHASCKAHLVFGLMDQFAICRWHLFEMADLGDRDEFLECHRKFLKNSILGLIKK